VTGAGAAEQEVQRAVAERVAAVRARIDAAARRAGRHADEVTLVAVSKRVPASRVLKTAKGAARKEQKGGTRWPFSTRTGSTGSPV